MAKTIQETISRPCCSYDDFLYTEVATGRRLSTASRIAHHVWNQMVARGEIVPHCKHCLEIHEFYTFTDAAGSTDWAFRPTGRFHGDH